MYGLSGNTNTSGDETKKLDVISNEVFINILESSGKVAAMVSEENENIIEVKKKNSNTKYIVCFDPLDGSSNIDANISIGTIFGIWRRLSENEEPVEESDYL